MAFQEIELNMIPHGDMPSFYASQYETGRPIIINVKMGEDDFACTDLFIELHARKVDDNIVTLEPDSVDGNQVVFVGTDQLFACPGKNLAELCLYADDAKDTSLGSLNFFIEVEPDPLEGGLTSETQIYNLTEQIEEITQQVIGDDYYDKTEVDGLLANKADQATTYTKSEVDTALNLKADKATTYTKSEVDSALALKADKSDTYTKTQVDNALALKADASDVYTKSQVDTALASKADTTYVDSGLALKANAADVYTKAQTYSQAEVDALIDGIFPTLSASGAIATFTTALTKQLVSVTADPLATIITCCGVNLWDEVTELGYISWTGVNTPDTVHLRSKNYIPCKGGVTLYVSNPNSIQFFYYDVNKNFIDYEPSSKKNATFTPPSNACYIRFYIYDTSYGTTYNHDISINYPSTDTAYHAYNGQTVPVADATTLVTQSGVNNVFADSGDVTVQYKYMSM